MKTLTVFLSALFGIVLWALLVLGAPAFATAPLTVPQDLGESVSWVNLVNARTDFTDPGDIGPTNSTVEFATARSQSVITGVDGYEWEFDREPCVIGLGNNDDEAPSGVQDLDFAFYSNGQDVWKAYVFGFEVAHGNFLHTDYFCLDIAPNGDVLYKQNQLIVYRAVSAPKAFPYYLRWKFAPTEPVPVPAPTPTPAPSPSPTPCKRLPNGKCKKN